MKLRFSLKKITGDCGDSTAVLAIPKNSMRVESDVFVIEEFSEQCSMRKKRELSQVVELSLLNQIVIVRQPNIEPLGLAEC